MTPLDLLIVAAYFVGVLAIGLYFGRRQSGAADYFLGGHNLPWWAVMFSIVATETSALTVISVPGIGARGDLTFLQLPMGYVLGRIGVALWLLPGYFRGNQETTYARLETRFGIRARQVSSAVFMVVRALGDSVRIFATAIPLTLITGWSLGTSVIVMSAVILIYSWAGGLKAVVWVDAMQLVLYLLAGVATLVVAADLAGGLGPALARAGAEGKLQVFNWSGSFTVPYTFFGGLIGGALLSAASHGTDHLIVQRLLATPSLADARRALVTSGIFVLGQFALFLLVGTALWAAGVSSDPSVPGDELLPRFVLAQLPTGLAGLAVAGILAAAMSSSLSALASATTHDFYAPLTGRRDERHLLTVGRWATFGWAVLLALGAFLFQAAGQGQPVVVLALSIASITYGGLLGTFILTGIPRVRQRDAITAIVITVAIMLVVFFWKSGPLGKLAFPWYVPMGTAIAVAAGYLSSLVGPAERRGDGA